MSRGPGHGWATPEPREEMEAAAKAGLWVPATRESIAQNL